MPRLPLGRAHMLASTTIEALWRDGAEANAITPVGSLRRAAAEVADVAILGITTRIPEFLDASTRLASARHVLTRTPTAVKLATDRGEITIHAADPASGGVALLCYTGSSAHINALSALADDRGLHLGSGHLTDAHGRPVLCRTEEDLYERLGIPFIVPELRDSGDEIQAARERRLPSLLNDLHMRGDLHMHTTWSDGRDSVDAMVHAALGLGYEYVAITDHSQSSPSARNLSVDDVMRQRLEIVHARRQCPRIDVLHGAEVDILPDGALDFADSMLEGFDIVLASLHDHAGQSADRLTDRYLRAIASPFVNVITHPANRSPAQSPGYDLDFDRIFTAAARTGTAMEIDGSPTHLDMDGALARRAVAAGVTVAVNSDCHRADALGRQMRFGVATARRGWIEPRHVLNTRSAAQVREFVSRKRARG